MCLRLVLLIAFAPALLAQSTMANPDFEQGSPGAVPEGWFVPTAFAGFQAVRVEQGCHQGKGCAEISPYSSSNRPKLRCAADRFRNSGRDSRPAETRAG